MANAQKLIYRVSDVRQALGLSTATIYRMCDRGELVKGKIGGTRNVGITAASVEALAAKMSLSDASAPQLGSQMGSQTANLTSESAENPCHP